MEGIVPRKGKELPVEKYKKVFFESISKTIVLTEGVKEKLNSMLDEVMFFFKNVPANNLRVSDLIKLQKKTLPLGGLTENSPALTKALSLIGKEVQTGDRLKILIRSWFEYILQEYKGISPILAFRKELLELEKTLKNSTTNKGLQGEHSDVDKVLGAEGIVNVLKKVSARLIAGIQDLTNDQEDKPQDISGSIEHERFGDRKPLNIKNQPSITNKFDFYQERGLPTQKSKQLQESVILTSLLAALSTN